MAESDDHAVAFATGGMREVTAVKLAAFGVTGPVATAADHTFREHVVREAIHQAGAGFDRVISVGDGPWDVRAAVAIGSECVGSSPAPFGPWFPESAVFASFVDIDLSADFTLVALEDVVEPDAFTARPAACACWN
ncbi:HAD family hydrolase [Actinokineospora globicatena]|uniref:Haloacid dehalogenase-like hydrolase n=1 Tax=Actinokineospora globicatena TaxID=103729 RepID=A0A9W6QM63_9PSEU|nr:hypothetical protein [Actinokineospora globicatena]GLW91109.1 hypothetical protein Aglo03_19250 [Actinokineospora globicatena]